MFDLARNTSPETRSGRRKNAQKANTEPTVTAYGEIDGVGMGTLSTGETFVTQRGLATLCGVQNAHIGTISRDWDLAKPRVLAIRARLGFKRAAAHRVLTFEGRRLYAYDMAVANAVLGYYAEDAGLHIQPEAARTRARFGDNGLKSYVLAQFSALTPPAEPIRFVPTEAGESEDTGAIAAFLIRIWSLYVLSFWMAINHIEELRSRWARAPWNRLGLYLPMKAVLEIQAEVVRRNASLGLRFPPV